MNQELITISVRDDLILRQHGELLNIVKYIAMLTVMKKLYVILHNDTLDFGDRAWIKRFSL